MIKQHYQSIIIQIVCTLFIPFIQLFALYVVFHGDFGPGGGFQGGVLLAVGVILQRLYLGKEVSCQRFSPKLAMVFTAIGMLIWILAGIVPVFMGGPFLDYAYLPIPWVHGPELRAMGILIVEIGVAFTVFGTLVVLFDNLAGERW